MFHFFIDIITLLKKNSSLILSILLYIIFTALSGIGCPILFFTGVPCLGCGMTRAVICLLKFDFLEAYRLHPLCFLMPVFAGIIMFRDRMGKRTFNACLFIIVVMFILVYLMRLLNPSDMLIKIKLSNGFIYKTAYNILERRSY